MDASKMNTHEYINLNVEGETRELNMAALSRVSCHGVILHRYAPWVQGRCAIILQLVRNMCHAAHAQFLPKYCNNAPFSWC